MSWRTPFNKEQRYRIKVNLMLKQDCSCYYCHRLMTLKVNSKLQPFPHTATFEHLVPRSAGGSNMEGNIVLACHQCNYTRGKRWEQYS